MNNLNYFGFLFLFILAINCQKKNPHSVILTIEIPEEEPIKITGNQLTVADYGRVPYGLAIQGELKVASPIDACDSLYVNEEDHSKHDDTMPFGLIAERDNCKFIQKTQNAQAFGAKIFIIINTKKEIESEILMIGEGSDISIPTIMISEMYREKLHQAFEHEYPLYFSIQFGQPQQQDIVTIDYWMYAGDQASYNYILSAFTNIKLPHQTIDPTNQRMVQIQQVDFRVHYIYWVLYEAYLENNYTYFDNTQCISGGRYCARDPDMSAYFDGPIEGRDMVLENLRQYCIYSNSEYLNKTKGYAGSKYISYLYNFNKDCLPKILADGETSTATVNVQQCSEEVMKKAKIDSQIVNKCVQQTFENKHFDISQESDQMNNIIEEERSKLAGENIIKYPSLYINDINYRGNIFSKEVTEVICLGLNSVVKLAYPECYSDFDKYFEYKTKKHIGTWAILAIILSSLVVIFLIILFFYRRQIKKEMYVEMQQQVNTAISQYYAMNDSMNVKKGELSNL